MTTSLAQLGKLTQRIADVLRTKHAAPVLLEAIETILGLVLLKVISDNQDMPYQCTGAATWEQLEQYYGTDKKARVQKAFQSLKNQNAQLVGLFSSMEENGGLTDTEVAEVVRLLSTHSLDRRGMDEPDPVAGTLAQWVENLLQTLLSTRQSGGYITPSSITTLTVRLLDPQMGGAMYDGAIGIGGNAISFAKYLGNGPSRLIHGQEEDQHIWRICRMNLILHGLYEADIRLGDTLVSPQFLVQNQSVIRQFDYVLMDMPFGLRWNPKADEYGRFSPVAGKLNGDMAFVQHAVASLARTGKAILVVSNGVLWNKAGQLQSIRSFLFGASQDIVEAVIALPANLYPDTGIPVSLLVLNRNKDETRRSKVLMVNAETDYLSKRGQNVLQEEHINRIVSVYRGFVSEEEFSRVVTADELASKDWNLMPAEYITKRRVETSLGEFLVKSEGMGATMQLDGIPGVEIIRGIPAPKKSGKATDAEPTHRVINLSDVGWNGELPPVEDLDGITLTPSKAKNLELRKDDIIVSVRGTALKIAIIPATDTKLVLSPNFLGIRFDPGQAEYDPMFVKYFLESPLGRFQLENAQSGSAMTMIPLRAFKALALPVIPLKKQKQAANALQQADEELRIAIEAAQSKRKKEYLRAYSSVGIADAIVDIS